MALRLISVSLLILIAQITMNNGSVCLGAQAAQSNQNASRESTQLKLIKGLLDREFYGLAEDELQSFLTQDHPASQVRKANLYLIQALKQQGKTQQALKIIRNLRQTVEQSKQLAQLNMTAGEMLYNAGNYNQAGKYFKLLLSHQDSLIREAAMFYLGNCYARENRLNNAQSVYNRLAQKEFDDKHVYRPYAAFELAQLAKKQKNSAKALEYFDKLVQNSGVPDSLKKEALYKAGILSRQQQKRDQAVKYFQKLTDKYPGSTFAKRAVQKLARMYLETDTPRKTLETLDKFQKTCEPDETDYRLQYLRALALVQTQSFASALTHLNSIIKNAEVTENYRELAAYQKVYCLFKSDAYQEATVAAKSFEDKHPESKYLSNVLYYRGLAAFREGDFSTAIESFSRCLKQIPEPKEWQYYSATLQFLARAHIKEDSLLKAAEIYQKLTGENISGNRTGFLLKAANLLQEADEKDKAIAIYKDVIQLSTTTPEEIKNAVTRLSRIYLENDKFQKAETLIKEHVDKLGHASSQLALLMGFSQYKQDKHQQALQTLQQLLAEKNLKPRIKAQARYLLGASLLRTDQLDKALDVFGKILEMDVNVRPQLEKPLMLRIATLYYDRNQYSQSRSVLKQILPTDDKEIKHKATLLNAKLLMANNNYTKTIDILSALCASQQQADAGAGCGEAYSLLG